MTRNPNNRPDKGFSRELQSKSAQPQKGKEGFKWNKPVAPVSEISSMRTPSRLQNHRAVKAQKGEFAAQTIEHRNNKGK